MKLRPSLSRSLSVKVNRVVAPAARRQVARMLKSDFVRELEAELELDADARGASAAWLDFATQLGCNALGVFAAFKCEGLLLAFSSCLVGADLIVKKITRAAERSLPRVEGERVEQTYGKALTTVQYAFAGAGFYWQTLGGGGRLPSVLYPALALPLIGERALASLALTARATRAG